MYKPTKATKAKATKTNSLYFFLISLGRNIFYYLQKSKISNVLITNGKYIFLQIKNQNFFIA